jgi:HTH-type transcriptional regulator/antitoxin MqsA
MNNHAPICPICEEGYLEPASYTGEITHHGQTLKVADLECWHCVKCGADPVFPNQARRNYARYQAARNLADGLPSDL